jgi:hypothetical protein
MSRALLVVVRLAPSAATHLELFMNGRATGDEMKPSVWQEAGDR